MSLILEALRKSEAERQRGMPPRLDSPMLRPTRRRQRLAPGLALLVLGVPAAGWFVYRGVAPEGDGVERGSLAELALQDIESTSAPTSDTASDPAPVALATSPQAADHGSGKVAAESAVQAAETDTRTLTALRREAALGSTAGLSGSASFGSELTLPERIRPHTPSVEGSEAATPQITATAPPVADPAEAGSAPAAVSAVDIPSPPAQPANPAPQPAPAQVAVVAPPEPPSSNPPAPAPVQADPPAEVIPFVYELDFSVRRDLPKMDMSMHVYSADPEARFIVINGKRFAEGDQAESDVLLREVRREGAVLVFRGTAFILPRQGF